MIINERTFYLWRIEFWWVAFDKKEFYPKQRIHLFRNLFWRI